jgi:ribosomal protein L10
VVLYGCEMWSLKDKCRLKVYENSLLSRYLGQSGYEVKWEWRKLHNEELNDLYSLPNGVRVIKLR